MSHYCPPKSRGSAKFVQAATAAAMLLFIKFVISANSCGEMKEVTQYSILETKILDKKRMKTEHHLIFKTVLLS
jgi:hypothetical protein